MFVFGCCAKNLKLTVMRLFSLPYLEQKLSTKTKNKTQNGKENFNQAESRQWN